MDFRRLEVFTKVYQQKSFSKAGQALYLSQPTVSEHIRLLEEDLGLILFDRQGKEIVPTKAGQFLFQYANQLMSLRQDLLRAMEQFRDKGVGELLIGGSNIPGQYILPGLLGSFKKKFPGIRIRLSIGDTQHIQEKVLDGTVELGLVGALSEHRRISCQPWTTDELICISLRASPGETKGPEQYVVLCAALARVRIAKGKAYLYYFTHVPPTAPGTPSRGATHGAETSYVFQNLTPASLPWTDLDRQVADALSSYWANFAAKGDPNGKGLPVWPAINPNGDSRRMVLGDKIEVGSALEASKYDFFDAYYSSLQKR